MTQPTPMQLLESGCSMIPVQANKKPALSSWKQFQNARPTKEELEHWSSELRPQAYAVVTGAISARVTFDFDGEKGRRLAERWGIRPHRKTGSGGLHLDVVHPGWSVPTLNSRSDGGLGECWPGLDVRGDGGYVIVLGRNDSNGPYEWVRDPKPDLLEVIPAEVWEYLHRHSVDCQAAKSTTVRDTAMSVNRGSRIESAMLLRRALDQAVSEGRNNAGFWLVTQLRDNGYSESEACAVMGDYVAQVPPVNVKGQLERYTKCEALSSVREAYSRPPREPWSRKNVGLVEMQHLHPGAGAQKKPVRLPDLVNYQFNDYGNSQRLIAFLAMICATAMHSRNGSLGTECAGASTRPARLGT